MLRGVYAVKLNIKDFDRLGVTFPPRNGPMWFHRFRTRYASAANKVDNI